MFSLLGQPFNRTVVASTLYAKMYPQRRHLNAFIRLEQRCSREIIVVTFH